MTVGTVSAVSVILGLNAYHADSAAAVVRDGRLVAAAEEERFRRVKHWAGFPSLAIQYCLEEAGVSISEVDHIAVNQKNTANLGRRLGYVALHPPRPSALAERLRNRRARGNIAGELAEAFPGSEISAKIHNVEHHLAHIASAFFASDFHESAVASVDGFGDFASGAWGRANGSTIDIMSRVHYPHSLGVFYQAMTQWLGFPFYGDEYKVMGLAPYGEPRYTSKIHELVRLFPDGKYGLNQDFFTVKDGIEYTWSGGQPEFGPLYSPVLEDHLGPARDKDDPLEQFHKDVARSVQEVFEDAYFNLLNALHAVVPSPNLCLAGGCAMNSVANGKVYDRTPFTSMYLPAAAGDAGGAVGTALLISEELGESVERPIMGAYLGPGFSRDSLQETMTRFDVELGSAGAQTIEYADQTELVDVVAQALAHGAVVGWFQGRMEWGPRALGARSILADPRRIEMKDVLNLKVKRRESFRPFAPSIVREAVPEWFETDDDVPFMMQVFKVQEHRRPQLQATTHVDGSGRLHTVAHDVNPIYWELINRFGAITGVPVVLNTSFNENEPVVCKPEEAINTFLRTNIDMLVLGPFVITRATEHV
jgi:carbamoyltransferase